MKSPSHSCFYQHRNLSKSRSSVPYCAFESVIHASVLSPPDNCHSSCPCLTNSPLKKLQLVQNAAARLLMKYRIYFRIILCTSKALNYQAPDKIRDLFTPYLANRSLGSSDQAHLAACWDEFKTKSDQAFAVMAPRLWNSIKLSLPAVWTLLNSVLKPTCSDRPFVDIMSYIIII